MLFKLSLLLVVSLFVANVDAGLHSVGSWRPMKQSDLESDGFRECLGAAAAEYNARFAASSGGDDSAASAATVSSVSHASQQVVAGMKYKFTAKMTVPGCDSCPERSCKFQVWYQAWMPQRTEVLSVDC